jgi:hypothetical protein
MKKKIFIVMLVVLVLVPQAYAGKGILWEVFSPARIADMAHHIMNARQAGMAKDKMLEIFKKQEDIAIQKSPKYKELFLTFSKLPRKIIEDAYNTPVRATTRERELEIETFTQKWKLIALTAKKEAAEDE